MSSKIYHGAPGSYKSSTAVLTIYQALMAGRCVITNIEGICPLIKFERVFNCKFPSGAKLFRFSTLKEEGVYFLGRWFQWLPIGALLVIDEVQNVYPSKDTKELSSFNYVNKTDQEFSSLSMIKSFSEFMPTELLDYCITQLENVEDDSYTDDSGLSERDLNGHIIYPKDIKNALMRHRKFNWDIIVCTPEIGHVHSLIRNVTEVACRHVSMDYIPLPYFQQRPRVNEHSPKESGYPIKKNQSIYKNKVSLNVFQLYKSTQTGKNNKSGQAKNPFKSAVLLFGSLAFLSIISYQIYFWFFDDSTSPDTTTLQVRDVNLSSDSKNLSKSKTINPKGSNSFNNNSNFQNDISFDLPDVLEVYGAEKIYLTGVIKKIHSNKRVSYEFFFNINTSEGEYSVNGFDLLNMGYQIGYKSDCNVLLFSKVNQRHVFCPPNEIFDSPAESSENIDVSPKEQISF